MEETSLRRTKSEQKRISQDLLGGFSQLSVRENLLVSFSQLSAKDNLPKMQFE